MTPCVLRFLACAADFCCDRFGTGTHRCIRRCRCPTANRGICLLLRWKVESTHGGARRSRTVRPIEHFIVAVVPVLLYVVIRDRQLPSSRLVWIVFFGSQFPDLVDKPLAHVFFVLPSGRVFMHSLPFAVPISIGVLGYAWRTRRPRAGVAFVFAYLSHLAADNYRAFIGPNPHVPPDLLWPLVPPKPRPIVPYWAGPASINLHLWTLFSVIVLSVTAYFLVTDFTERVGL